jgi:hypothetical protein
MMKIITVLVSIYLTVSFLSGCDSKQLNNKGIATSSAASWAFEFVVYNGHIYKVTADKVINVGKEIGTVTNYSDTEGTYTGNFSNIYPVGTKYYEIQGIDTNKSIAIKLKGGGYIRADNQGKYGAK